MPRAEPSLPRRAAVSARRAFTLALAFIVVAPVPWLAAPAAAQAPAAAPGSAQVAVQGVRVPDHVRTVLPNGLTLVVVPRPEIPMLTFSAVLRAGAIVDPAGKAGLANLTASLLEKGAGDRDADAFAEAVEGAGGSFGAQADLESIEIGGSFLARDAELALGLLADVLLRPRLEAAEFDALRARQVEFIKSAKDSDPGSLAPVYGAALLFGAHPYATPAFGSPRSLAAITHDDVRAFHRAHFGADRLTLVVAGDVDPAVIGPAVQRAFAGMPRATGVQPVLAEPPRLQGRRVLLVDAPGAAQTYFWLGNTGVARRYPSRAALDVVNTLYGGRFTSILNTELRVKSGLSYGASSGFVRGTVAGPFAIRSFAQTGNTRRAVDLALETLGGLRRGSVEPAMLESARNYVIGQYPLRFETAANWADALADLEFYGLGRDHIEGYGAALEAVDAGAARAVIAEAFPDPGDLAIVLIGDAAKIRADARRFGPVTEIPLESDDYLPAARR